MRSGLAAGLAVLLSCVVLAGCWSSTPGSATAVGGTSVTTNPATTATTTATGPAGGLPYGTYPVVIAGSVSGYGFERDARIDIVPTIAGVGTTNGVNGLDLCLHSGFPGAVPETGAIRFGSNTGCFPGADAADLDVGYVTLDDDTVTVEPDESLAAVPGSVFTSDNSLAACPFAPVSGSVSITVFPDGSLDGTIDVVGYGGAACGESRYQAEITG